MRLTLGKTDLAVKALLELNREFPDDPEVLFATTHIYSDLASRASQELAAKAPTSPQAQQLEAEAFESQGDWDKATAEYKKILAQEPQQHGIHYRMGRVDLAKTPPDAENAKGRVRRPLAAGSIDLRFQERQRTCGDVREPSSRLRSGGGLHIEGRQRIRRNGADSARCRMECVQHLRSPRPRCA